MTLEDAYKTFKTLNGEIKIGLTMFKKLKPYNVKKFLKQVKDLAYAKYLATLHLNFWL